MVGQPPAYRPIYCLLFTHIASDIYIYIYIYIYYLPQYMFMADMHCATDSFVCASRNVNVRRILYTMKVSIIVSASMK